MKRKRVYVGTGNAYTFPAAVGTDSVIALDANTGKIVWQHQEVKGRRLHQQLPGHKPRRRQLSRDPGARL
jgi:glucose dehydrogenase